MAEKRVQFNKIVKSQLPAYVRDEFPLIGEFLTEYYRGQEYQGGPIDLIENIDSYIKLNECGNTVGFTSLSSSVDSIDSTISVDNTDGFPQNYGLIRINDEIITYTGITTNSFTGCIRGFSGITSFRNPDDTEDLVFSTSSSDSHSEDARVENLSVLFLNEFLTKVKKQVLPGLQTRDLDADLNQPQFIRHSKDFYSTRGTDVSFKILFKALYGENVEIIRPRDYVISPSFANYKKQRSIIVEAVSGDPFDLVNNTLFQDAYENISRASSPVASVERITVGILTDVFYRLGIDGSFIQNTGTSNLLYDQFSTHAKTQVIGEVGIGQTIIDVDSTLGFPSAGTLSVIYKNSTVGVVSYTSKTVNQFFGVDGVTSVIGDSAEIDQNTFAYSAGLGRTDGIRVKIRSVLNDLEVPNNTHNQKIGSRIKIKSLGRIGEDVRSNNWFFNTAQNYEVESLTLVDDANGIFRLVTKDFNILKIGDKLNLTDTGEEIIENFIVNDVFNETTCLIRGFGVANPDTILKVTRTLSKVDSDIHQNLSAVTTDIQNVYSESGKNLVAAPSIPNFSDIKINPKTQKVAFSGTYRTGEDTFKITDRIDHNYYTGDAVYYTPEKNADGDIVTTLGFDEGLYFIRRVDENNIKLAKSPSNLYNNIFQKVSSSLPIVTINSNTIEKYNFKNKSIKPQKLLREVANPVNDGVKHPTTSGYNGILINGVEVLNYKSKNFVYYGRINSIDVVSGGKNYDVVNPPVLRIKDENDAGTIIGTGATGFLAVNGQFDEVRVLDPGFDYLDVPKVKISGGNPTRNAVAEAKLSVVPHEVTFNSTGIGSIGIGSASSSVGRIGFSTHHKFRNGERIIYRTFGKQALSGLSTDATYFVSVVDPQTVKLHTKLNDSISGINTISISDYGIGYHALRSLNGKAIINTITLVDSGEGYQNKKRTCGTVGIITALNTISIPNHDFKSGEIVSYSVDGTEVTGLSTTSDYYVTVVDRDSFKLSVVGLGTTTNDFYYKTKQYENLTNVGVGTHTFNYPDIKVELIGSVGISSVEGKTYQAVVQPIVRGEITSIHLENSGVGYGSSEVINFKRSPSIDFLSGQDAELTPIVNAQGKIVDVIVDNSGFGYNSPPRLIVSDKGNGTGAILVPEIGPGLNAAGQTVQGAIKSVNINQAGIGYGVSTTSITVEPAGSGAVFNVNLQSWRINEFAKNLTNITEDDVFISPGTNIQNELQCSYVYAPRSLRQVVYATDQGGRILYGKKDLNLVDGVERINNDNHSPIIGWAYDGHPIYGPFGYSTKSGGTIVQLKSGYSLDIKPNRPPLSIFPEEFFIEDFSWANSTDEAVLDQNNGRFCITPEYPNGTYAYFSTFDLTPSSDGVFKNFKKPQFPYLVGENFNSKPNPFNYRRKSNQDDVDLNASDWIRNSYPYSLRGENSGYEYVSQSYKYVSQDSIIKHVQKGSVDSVGIITGGSDYRVNDKVVFEQDETDGFFAAAKVHKVSGVGVGTVSVSSSNLDGVEFYPVGINGNFIGINTGKHGFLNADTVIISGLSTTSSLLEGSYQIGVTTSKYRLDKALSNSNTTGIVTYFSLFGNLNPDFIRENDILKVDSEEVKVLNVDRVSSRVRVLRAVNGTVSAAHTATAFVESQPRSFTVNVGYTTAFNRNRNREYYFDPLESVGLGTNSGVGIGITLNFSNPGAGITQYFVPTRSIYLPNHRFETGDTLTYQTNTGDTIGVATVSGGSSIPLTNHSLLFVAKLDEDSIGLSTVRVGLGTTGVFVGAAATTSHQELLYFVGLGTGSHHSFKISYPETITGNVEKNLVTVSAAGTHGLFNNDTVFVDINPSISTSFAIKYNAPNRKLVTTGIAFTSGNVTTGSDNLYLANHGLVTGQKVIHSSSSPSGGLASDKEYYAYVVDRNNIKLTESKFNANRAVPSFVSITSSSSGTIFPVNPPLKLYRDSNVTFDLSDVSLSYNKSGIKFPAFKFELYTDSNFNNLYDTNGNDATFDVTRTGTVGVTTDATIKLSVDKFTPSVLYYKLIPLNISDNPLVNREIVNDSDVSLNNEIIVRDSLFDGEYSIIKTSDNTFTYNLPEYPERDTYNSTESVLSYKTNSTTAYGAITDVLINNRGKGYTKVPGITTVTSSTGTGAILEASSKSIGKISKTTIENIGFDYPADRTLRPDTKIPQILRIEQLAGFSRVGVTSFGKNYSVPPKIVVVDGRTKKVIPDVDLRYVRDQETLDIVRNTFSLSNVTPTLIPIENSNGIRVSNMTFDSTTQDVTVTLRDSFSTVNTFPFTVNDKILVENTSVGVGSTGLGYNSANYDYSLFTVTKTHPNLGGIGIVTFSMAGFLESGEIPGFYNTGNSSGVIVPEKFFPTFDPTLETLGFREQDEITDGTSVGKVYQLDTESKYLVVESDNDFKVGTEILSEVTGSKGLVKERIAFDSKYSLDYFSVVESGWEYTTGFLNNELQKVHDNEYYQNFSYSVKSQVPFEKWNNVVSSLNHTAGFKKFSDLQVESVPTTKLTPTPIDGTLVEVKIDSLYNVNTYSNFDLAHENYLTNRVVAFSDEINFTTRILTDYSESITNRVLRIDDISGLFNNLPRPTPFSDAFRRAISESRLQKYITYVKDRLFTKERQLLLVTTLSDTVRGISMINQYGRLDPVLDLGSFDSVVEGSDSVLRFFPIKSRLNNYNVITLSYSMDQIGDVVSSIGGTTIGDSTGFTGSLVSLASSSVTVGGGNTVTLATLSGIGTTASNFRSAKVLVLAEASDGRIEYDELNLIHDGTEVELLEYGQLSIHSQDAYSAIGMGTYGVYLSGSDVVLSYDSDPGITTTIINTITVGLATESYIGIGTINLAFGSLTAKSTTITSSGSPTAVGIASFANEFDAGYCIVQVSDTSNNRHQLSEVLIIDDDDEVYLTEYANIETFAGLGTMGGVRTGDRTELTFTPNSGIDVHVKTFTHALRDTEASDISENVQLNNIAIEDNFSVYTGTEVEVKKDFFLTHKDNPVFLRVFDGSSDSIIDVDASTILVPNHFFVSGEEVTYTTSGVSTNSIGIAATTIPGVGSTDKLPETVFAIKVDEKKIQLAATAENALRTIPIALDFTSVGIGTSHVITSTKQNNKVLISLDNVVQTPIVGTSVTTSLSQDFSISQDIAFFSGITSFFGGDSVKIGDEIMKVQGVGIGSTNAIKLTRALAGTTLVAHSSGTPITKLRGNYNIVGSTLSFIDAPFGKSPIGTSVGPGDERDFLGITSSSTFSGRSFMRSGVVGSSDETYTKNYIFDDISQNFSGTRDTYTLTSDGSNVIGVSTFNSILLVNGIVQGPGATNDYTLSETSGITSVTFTGSISTTAVYNPNDLNVPIGGVIISVAGTNGFGYQPLVSAGGTAVISAAGTVSSISIGNSGSGYRSGIQTTVNVGVAVSSTGTPSIAFIGTAAINNGNIVSIAVTNPGVGYTSTNPPVVIIDPPLPYSDIALQYSSDSVGSGGTGAKINVTVGQGSSVISFSLANFGFGYGLGDILTIPTGGSTGIPTTASSDFKEFQVEVLEINTDSFSAWTLGDIEVLDDFSSLFDGQRKSFPITRSGQQLSLQSDLGSLVNIEDVLIIFINDVLQVPGSSYFFIENRRGPFGGGSNVTFEEAPKAGDTLKFLIYKGTSGTDVLDKEVIDTIKVGDDLTIGWDPSLGQQSFLQQNTRVVTELNSSSSVDTNVYYGPALSEDSTLYRPVDWTKQMEDRVVNGQYIYKNRELYESIIFPTANLIKSVGIGSTVVFVDNARPLFNAKNESAIDLNFQREITLVDYSSIAVGAAATVHVTDAGGIENFVISNGGIGYTSSNPPEVTIGTPVGLDTTARATATATVSVAGTVSAISVGSTVGFGYTNQSSPIVLISPPTIEQEKNTIVSYEGDFGLITGIGTTSTTEAPIGLTFDLVIPENSVLRNSEITDFTSRSGLETGYYFTVFNSNVGSGVTSLDETNNHETGIIGIGSTFIDNVYRVASVGIATTSAIGFGVTTLTRVTVSVASHEDFLSIPGLGYSDFYGEYSWGKLQLSDRNKNHNYVARTRKGYSGITTGPVIRRTNRLRYQDYST